VFLDPERAKSYESGEGFYESGEVLELWTDFTLHESFLDPVGKLSVTVFPTNDKFDDYRKKLSKGNAIQFLIGGNLQATGVITTQTFSMSRNGTAITLDVKGLLTAAYEASISPKFSISSKTDIPVSQLIMTVLSPFFSNRNLDLNNNTGTDLMVKSGQTVTSPLGNLPPPVPVTKLKAKQLSAQKGEKAYGFVSRVISRLGFILKTDVFGGLMLDRPIYEQGASYTLFDGSYASEAGEGLVSGDLMLDGINVSDTNDGQFSEIVVGGQALMKKSNKKAAPGAVNQPQVQVGQTAAKKPIFGPAPDKPGAVRANKPVAGVRIEGAIDVYTNDYENTNRWFKVTGGRKQMLFPYKSVAYKTIERERFHYKSDFQPYKPKFSEDKMSRDIERCQTFAELMLGLRAPGGFKISCSVAGFVAASGAMWTPNTVVRVIIKKLDIDEDMWIFSRQFSASRTSGQITSLVLLPLNSLILGAVPK
jgi:hypothetical protein